MNHQTDGYTHLYHTLATCMTEKDFLRRIKLTAPDMAALLQTADTNRLAEALLAGTDERGRFSAKKVLALHAVNPLLPQLPKPPQPRLPLQRLPKPPQPRLPLLSPLTISTTT